MSGLRDQFETLPYYYQLPLYLAVCSDGIIDKTGNTVEAPSPLADDVTFHLNNELLNPSAQQLVRWAHDRGSSDDISAVTIELTEPPENLIIAFVMDGHFGKHAVQEAGRAFVQTLRSSGYVLDYSYSHPHELQPVFAPGFRAPQP